MVSVTNYSNPLNLPQAPAVIVSRVFTDEFTNASPIPYMNGGILSRMKCVINFYTFLSFENQPMIFTLGANTISNNTQTIAYNFIDKGWRVGMTVTVEGTSTNNGSYTVTNVTANVLTVTGGALATETADNASLFDDTPITALDFYYNLIANNAPATYYSLTDNNAIQRFSVSGLDASDTGTTHNFSVASPSYGWVTNAINSGGVTTGDVTIVGAGITGHKQYFTITQYFSVAPFWTDDLLVNFQNSIAPDYFLNSTLKHIFQLDAKFTAGNPNVPYTGGIINENGLSDWFNANNAATRPEYSVESITYTDFDTSEVLDSLDIDRTVLVAVVVNSRNGVFVNGAPSSPSTMFALDFVLCPMDRSDYQGTVSTLRQNLFNDRLFFDADDAPQNGEFFGTAYQVFEDIEISALSSTQATASFKVVFSSQIKAFLKTKADTNRYYYLSVTTQNLTITGTEQSDRVPLLADFNTITYNQDDTTLLALVDGFRINNYPNVGAANANQVRGYEGEPVFAKFPFIVLTESVDDITPTLNLAGVQVVASHADFEDVILEQKTFNTAFVRKLDGIQTIDFNETRGFNLPDASPYNVLSLVRDDSFDTVIGGKQYSGFQITYAFALRYEYWLELLPAAQAFQNALFETIETPTEQWFSLIAGGWSLNLKFIASIRGYGSYVTQFECYGPIVIKELESAPDTGPSFTWNTKYYNLDDVEVDDSALSGNKTKIVTTFTGDFSGDYFGFWAYIFADLSTSTGILNRRFASTTTDSEDDNPFIAAAADATADSSTSSANLTINIFGTSSITVECYYDDTKNNWGVNNDNVLINLKLGFYPLVT